MEIDVSRSFVRSFIHSFVSLFLFLFFLLYLSLFIVIIVVVVFFVSKFVFFINASYLTYVTDAKIFLQHHVLYCNNNVHVNSFNSLYFNAYRMKHLCSSIKYILDVFGFTIQITCISLFILSLMLHKHFQYVVLNFIFCIQMYMT
jgi:hypothetical protein